MPQNFDTSDFLPYLQLCWRTCPTECRGKTAQNSNQHYVCVFPDIIKNKIPILCHRIKSDPEALVTLAEYLHERVRDAGCMTD